MYIEGTLVSNILIFAILKMYFLSKMRRDSWFDLTDGYLWLWRFVPSIQMWIPLSKLLCHFSYNTSSFPWFSMAVARCCNVWNLNAWLTGLDASSEWHHRSMVTCDWSLLSLTTKRVHHTWRHSSNILIQHHSIHQDTGDEVVYQAHQRSLYECTTI